MAKIAPAVAALAFLTPKGILRDGGASLEGVMEAAHGQFLEVALYWAKQVGSS